MLALGHWTSSAAGTRRGGRARVSTAAFDDTAPYVMLNGAIAPGDAVPPPSDWNADTPRAMHDTMVAAVAGWHPAIRGLVDRIEPTTLFSHPFRRLDPTPAWPCRV